jgi:ribosome-associated protein
MSTVTNESESESVPEAGSGSGVAPALSIRELTVLAAKVADDKKAENIVILDVGDIIGITDAFVIAGASNRRLVVTVAEEIEVAVKAAGGPTPLSVEGLEDAKWVLIDFGPFVVHVFDNETREFYDLERLWKDAPRWEW